MPAPESGVLMKVKFNLDVKPFSINAMYYRDQRIKTQAAREWSMQVFHHLSDEDIQAKLKKCRDKFDDKKHYYEVRLIAYYPKNLLFRKAGGLSSKSHDISNWEKPLLDLLFLPKYFDKPHPQGAPNLNTDDKYLAKMISEKVPSADDEYRIEIWIKIKAVDQLSNRQDPEYPELDQSLSDHIH